MAPHQKNGCTPKIQELNQDLMLLIFSYLAIEEVHKFMLSNRAIFEYCCRDDVYKFILQQIIERNEIFTSKMVYNPQSRTMENNTEITNQSLKSISKNYRKELVKYGGNTKSSFHFYTKQEVMDITMDIDKLKTFSKRTAKYQIVGAGAVGKTTFLKKIAMHQESDAYIPTVYDNYPYSHEHMSFDLWDSAGQEDYDRLRPLSYVGVDMFFLSYSVVNRESYSLLFKKFIRELRYHSPNTPCVLVACKIDLRKDHELLKELSMRDEKPIAFEEGIQLAKHLKCITFWETSARTEEGFEKIGDLFTKLYYLKMTTLENSSKKSKTCFLQ